MWDVVHVGIVGKVESGSTYCAFMLSFQILTKLWVGSRFCHMEEMKLIITKSNKMWRYPLFHYGVGNVKLLGIFDALLSLRVSM